MCHTSSRDRTRTCDPLINSQRVPREYIDLPTAYGVLPHPEDARTPRYVPGKSTTEAL